jgi:hypothetical protein
VLDIIEVPAPHEVEDVTEQGLLLPVPGGGTNSILFEPRDGGEIGSLTAKAVTFSIGDRTALKVRKVRIDFFITDARFALCCSKYDKGGGWVGGPTAMIVFNGVSKARAALRSRGKVLAGQVRYPWLRWVASAPKTGYKTEEALALGWATEDGTALKLNLHLPKEVHSAAVAAEIAERAARYRLASEEFDRGAREALEALLGVQDRVAVGEKQSFAMPAPRPISEETARLMPEPAEFCGACGEEIAADDAFCSGCGEEVAR